MKEFLLDIDNYYHVQRPEEYKKVIVVVIFMKDHAF